MFVGAGAEVDLGFKSGSRFTQDTFYCQKNTLYKALDDFYRDRLGKSRDGLVPAKYEPAFLFNSTGRAFKDLVQNLVRDNSSFVFDLLDKTLEEIYDVKNYSPDDYRKLFASIVVESTTGASANDMSRSIPKDSHFGILEQYYSELLDPNAHLLRFWKLVNFYWSAYFSIALPITNKLYAGNRAYEDSRYAFVLGNLDDTVHRMYDDCNIKSAVDVDCYYSALQGKFDHVITTNYTPYAATVVGGDESRISWLGGKLSQFEALPDLEFVDYSKCDNHIEGSDFVFPYLLCQSPVKPVISLAQVNEFAKASRALGLSNELVVLGYSFCNEDAHICSMIGESLRNNSGRKLIYFQYCTGDTTFSTAKAKADLEKKLRIGGTVLDRQVEIVPIQDCASEEFAKRCATWSRP